MNPLFLQLPFSRLHRLRGARRAASAGALAATVLAGAAAWAQGALPQVELSAGMHLIHAELASTDSARMRGLMYRRTLEPNHGMLFIFDAAGAQCMWMRNTLLPLSVAFIDADGSIVNIEEMQAQTDDTHCARRSVRYALEMEGGWFKAHGLRAGSVIKGIDRAAAER